MNPMTTDTAAPPVLVTAHVNGRRATMLADPRDTLLILLRDRLALPGTKEGCGDGNCGSCTVLLDGQPVNACLVLAQEAQGRHIVTIEGIGADGTPNDLQKNLAALGGTQCGFCTPGIVMSATALLAESPNPDDAEIREAIAGNLCRCTGYDKIVRAIAKTAADRKTSATQ